MPNLLKSLAVALIVSSGGFLATSAFAADVEVEFSSKLGAKMSDINRVEQGKEERFRRDLDDGNITNANSSRRANVTRFANVAWAGVTLVPDIKNFTVKNFTAAMVKEALNRAGMGDLEGTIRVRIDRLRVSNHPVSYLTSFDSYVIGTLEQVDAKGNVINSAKVSANLVVARTVDHDYQGPDYAFTSTDPRNRVGPVLSRFVQKGLETLFVGEEFSGPIVIEGS